jgi:hypothetical protein
MRLFSALLLTLATSAGHASDHKEFDATLLAPYRGVPGGEARTFRINLEHPELDLPYKVAWKLELKDSAGGIRRSWRGEQMVKGAPVAINIDWNGSFNGQAAAAGTYRATMSAAGIEQSWDIAVGPVLSAASLAPQAFAASPWRIVLGNLHSQTGHSDGGGALADCHGAQEPQSSLLGPGDAFAYADRHGLDVLVASEHNHMYDGSNATNAGADPRSVRWLYQTGLTAAADYNRDHPGFLGIYGVEWGVIGHGGHLNIFNADRLPGWETNGDGALLADVATPKSDYPGLYGAMRQRGWIGQFNHPASTDQFLVDGKPLGYSADGDAVMVLCEMVNTNAFSTTEHEDETRHTIFENACNQALEAGYHVAFSSNQDNHCANWGMSSTNRTGVLLHAGEALDQQAFLNALRARRVFATMDKAGSLLLGANGHVMGERFSNQGPLHLQAQFASSAGKSAAQVAIYHGVPGRNGSVTQVADSFDSTIVPAPGEHFYYAKVTQSDGKLLWSAPIWVTQRP